MATSSGINKFLSLFLPTKPPQQQPPSPTSFQFNPNTTSSSSETHKPSKPLTAEYHHPCSSSELSSVICPSLAYTSTLFFRSPYNVQVVVGQEEPEDKLLSRFRREVSRAGVIQECRRGRYFENKHDQKKRETRQANRKRLPGPKAAAQIKQDVAATKREEYDDNWDLPEGDTLY